MAPPKAKTTAAVPWNKAKPAPVVLITGTEPLLAERAVLRIRAAARKADPAVEVHTMAAAGYENGQLSVLASPSLFSEPKLVVFTDCHVCQDVFVNDVLAYLNQVADDVTLVVQHGGTRGKKMLDAIKAHPQALVVDCPQVKKNERADFAAAEFRMARRAIEPEALRALVDAVGSDLRELAASCQQLLADIPADRAVQASDVDRYYGGRVEATGFKVADAVAAGRRDEALGLIRQAVDTGVDPVPLIAAIAMKLRTMAKVAGSAGGGSAQIARDLGLAPWQVERAQRELRGWTASGLATAMIAMADADEGVKGGGRDAVYAVERAVMIATGAAGRG